MRGRSGPLNRSRAAVDSQVRRGSGSIPTRPTMTSEVAPDDRRGQRRQQVAAVDDQGAERDDGVGTAQEQPSGGGGDGELDDEQGQQRPGGPAVEPQREDHGDAHQSLGGGEQHFLDLPGVEDQRGAAAAEEVRQWEGSDEQGPLVDLRGDQRRDGGGAFAAGGEEDRDDEFGSSRGERRQPLHEQELVDAQLGTGVDEAVGERFRARQDDRGRNAEHRDHRDPSGAVGESADGGGGADQVGFFDVAAGQFVEVEAEPCQQRNTEYEVD